MPMNQSDKVNILLVDDQPSKLLSYEVILRDLGENLIKAASAKEAFEQLLKTEIAIVLVDVCMPDLDGFQLASMIRDHPRFLKTAIIFVSAIHLTDMDHLRGYEAGAVDYVPVPVVPEVLRAKVKVFAELYRKTRQLEQLNEELERRVAKRTAELEASTARLLESEQRRSVALAAGQMGSWEWDVITGECVWDAGQYRIFGVDPNRFKPTFDKVRSFIYADDVERITGLVHAGLGDRQTFQTEVRIIRPNGEMRWCICAAAMTTDAAGRVARVSGVTIDISDRKEAEQRQVLLTREVDHRARNALAVTQSIVRLTRASTIKSYVAAVEGRIGALSRAHTLLSESRWQGADLIKLVDEELSPYRTSADKIVASGPHVSLRPVTAQILALALHELATNAAKYGALSSPSGKVKLSWQLDGECLRLQWIEAGGPTARQPTAQGFGTKIITASVATQLGGDAAFDWRSDGLHCTLSIPIADKIGPVERHSAPIWDANKAPVSMRSQVLPGSRVLLVEDEALVAMVMRDLLMELGFCVVGPFSRTAEAAAAARDGPVAAAVLDINLDGELVYPVADLLAARGIPFVFVTGYGAESIEPRFAHIPVLQKPVERQVLEGVFAINGHGAADAIAPVAAAYGPPPEAISERPSAHPG
jgi:two-component sensor histidine kinase/DNA-binding response OmpR family regulator